MALPRYFGLDRENSPKHASVEKNHDDSDGEQVGIAAKNSAEKQKGGQSVYYSAGTDVPGVAPAQPNAYSRQKINEEENTVGQFPVEIQKRKCEDQKWYRVR